MFKKTQAPIKQYSYLKVDLIGMLLFRVHSIRVVTCQGHRQGQCYILKLL